MQIFHYTIFVTYVDNLSMLLSFILDSDCKHLESAITLSKLQTLQLRYFSKTVQLFADIMRSSKAALEFRFVKINAIYFSFRNGKRNLKSLYNFQNDSFQIMVPFVIVKEHMEKNGQDQRKKKSKAVLRFAFWYGKTDLKK